MQEKLSDLNSARCIAGTVRCDTVAGSWSAGLTAGGRAGCSTFSCNTQYRVSAGSLKQAADKEEISVIITLYQPDCRGKRGKRAHEWSDMYLYLTDPEAADDPEGGDGTKGARQSCRP